MMSVMQDAFELCRERGRPLDLAHIPKTTRRRSTSCSTPTPSAFSNREPRPNGDLAADEAEMFLRRRD
jgi:hypothetical protein